MAAGLLDETEHLAETQTRALARAFGRIEGIEGALQHFAAHPDAAVRHRDHDILAGSHFVVRGGISLVEFGVLGLDRQFAAIGHGVPRVHRQIDDRTFELRGVDQHFPEPAGEHRFDVNGLADRALKQFRHAAGELVDVDDARLERLLTGERQQAGGQRRGAVRAFGRIVDAFQDGRMLGSGQSPAG